MATFGPSTVLSATLGWTRSDQGIELQDLNLNQLGFPSSLVSQLQLPKQYPNISLSGFLGTGLPLKSYSEVPSDTTTAEATLMKVVGHHSLKFGGEYRLIHASTIGLTDASGTYSFNSGWTSSNPNVTDANTGNSIASFLLGTPASASAGLNVEPYLSWHYPALFVQDDWQVKPQLTLNLGLRWDYESPPVERFDRQNRGFGFGVASPLQVPGLNLTGGLQFAGVDGQPRNAFDGDYSGWQPRVGVAYRIFKSKSLVFRAGLARYDMPSTDFGQTAGFSQETQALTSLATANGPVPNISLSNPFPGGLVQPQGSSMGMLTGAGGPVEFAYQGRTIPSLWTWSTGFEYELPLQIVIDASYVGSQARGLEVSKQLNYLTTDQLAMGTAALNKTVPNPFYGVLPASTPRGAKSTAATRDLLLQYPQFTTVTEDDYSAGRSRYNAFQFRAQRRFSNGVSFLVSYTVSKNISAVQYLNPQDAEPDSELAYFDVPRRLLLSGVFQLPFGHGKRWVQDGIASRIVGGWQLSTSVDLHPGIPLVYPSGYVLTGDPQLSSGQNLNQWFDTSSSLWVPQTPDTLRTTPFYSPNVRQYPVHQMDGQLSRTFRITERQSFHFLLSAFNLTNTPVFGAPNTSPTSSQFGVVSVTQINNPRNIQLGFKYTF